ncbi:hypothetical protein [Prauserella muralis]|uniref:Uncharacterized protein n=1 Tax=Prauserella muralis TaxID=588067 RepID=A0A2V4B498_9PSEU|nr:hypothetical protein [Prauserella muralis]PXY28208.1 hypothetical protein BAY60_17940 [Prauserella muralis]TWE21975.1 hypothetical protein FHX69_3207 [Prauserella muralis]
MSAGADPLDDPRWEWVRAAARTPAPTPPGLVERVLRSVRGVRGTLLTEPLELEQDGGRLRVGERAVVVLARRRGAELAGEIGGVHVAAVALEPGGLDVLVTVRYGTPADEVAEALRRGLRDALVAEFGPVAPAVNVHITDVYGG